MRVYNITDPDIPEGAVFIGRGSKYGNPFKIGVHGTRDEVIDKYVNEILPTLDLSDLAGKDLICYCKPKRCHGDYLLIHANRW